MGSERTYRVGGGQASYVLAGGRRRNGAGDEVDR